ncbi:MULTISPECIES: DUF881 domain-containing protein [Thermomonosporaceae]|uniref:DUF881 domain-containing protein n=1 Tax=Thermomonosporaceae TaxID=2012 RepID=UPI00255A9ED4|nr:MULTISPECIES: DUF881 domain-containing protein [Thermomonosporaceae]MDL4776567.1 DUF881 domain-containing protein [Actinomadura xylanilytica]
MSGPERAPGPDEAHSPAEPAKASGASGAGPARGWRRPDASMSLLSDLFAGKVLDPGYTEAAARRAAEGAAPAPRRGRLGGAGVLFVLTLVGVLVAVTGAEVRRSEPVAAEQRSRLVHEIRARTGESDELQRRLDRLRAETERARAVALARSTAGRHAREDLAAAGAAAAATPASGPAFVVTLDDAPRPGRDGRGAEDGRVYDQDLQILVNGLWAAGATAIGVNGQRLTATTAIRTAGEAILVDYRPLTGPYEVTALGDAGAVRDAFRDSAADRRLRLLEDRYRIRYETRRADRVRLPAAGALQPRYARPQEQGDGQDGGNGDGGGQ